MIPDFLKRKPNLDETSLKLKNTLSKYQEHFKGDPTLTTEGLEPRYLIELLEECIEKNITLSELLGEELGREGEYW